MSHPPKMIAGWRRAIVRLLGLVGRPARRAQGRGGIVVEPYRGYGSASEIFMIGRVFRQTAPRGETDVDDLRSHLRDIGRRIRRRKIAGAAISVSFAGAQTHVETDRDGYFRVHLKTVAHPIEDRGWHPVDLRLHTDPPVEAEGLVFIPPSTCRFVVVSDIDDTVMHTGVANRLLMLWRLFVADAESRTAFPGVAALYRALHEGVRGHEQNPLLYVSRAPWGIYDMLTAFFRLQGIPVGPVLFLREWGLSWRKPWPRRAEDHKRVLIERMLALYPDLPFILVGDSGQHDPEVYARIVATHPGRVQAIYIRDVSRSPGRSEEIEQLAAAVTRDGSRLLLAADSIAIARHAAGLGLIRDEAVAAVAEERREAGDASGSLPTKRVDPAEAAGDGSELGAVLADADAPANIVLEAPAAPDVPGKHGRPAPPAS
jgi:phosphatidate phosphatase APP1